MRAMSDLVSFLAARLDEDEATALAAGANDAERQWEAADHESASRIVTDANGDALIYNEGTPGLDEAAHIARHDPARVLREVTAKREILKHHDDNHECADLSGGEFPYVGCSVVRAYAVAYIDNPDYRAEWKPSDT